MTTRWTLSLCGACAVVAMAACSGGTNSSTQSSPTTPAPTPTGNPCASINIETSSATLREPTAAELAKREPSFCRRQDLNVLEAVWKHREARERAAGTGAGVTNRGGEAAADASADIGDIAVIQDQGDVMIPVNTFDLKGKALAFVRNAAGGYDVRAGDATFKQTLGQKMSLGDDQSASFALPFAASYFGKTYTGAFVNSDGNVTFEQAESASTARSVTRFLTGPPRVSLYFADLDPSAGGGVYVNTQADFFTVTWCNVPGFEESRKVTAQLVVQRDGLVEMKFADTTTMVTGVVGLSPGATNVLKPVDLAQSASSTVGGGEGAVGERFAETVDIDLAALGRRFYQTHADRYDQLVVWTDQSLVTDAFAYETTISNQITGIGASTFDVSSEFGSAGTLSSIAFMDHLDKYPADPTARVFGENSTLGLIGHESGHRWLVTLRFKDDVGATSGAWLGRDDVHWSFFMDSDASFDEGNDIRELGGGQFETVGAVERYSILDQYAMGLRAEWEVQPVFYVDNPTNVPAGRTKDSNPRVGITFNGTKRTVSIQDIVSALGARKPTVNDSPKLHRQAFVYVVSAGATADPAAAVAKLDRFRREWEPFFSTATNGRMRLQTRLNP